jgi:hypothetical protein
MSEERDRLPVCSLLVIVSVCLGTRSSLANLRAMDELDYNHGVGEEEDQADDVHSVSGIVDPLFVECAPR